MKIVDWKIGSKLILGFLAVVLIFGSTSVYQIIQLRVLADLQDEGAKRAKDAMEISNIADRVTELYSLIADAVINRNLRRTREEFEPHKALAQKDIARLKEIVGTVKEATDNVASGAQQMSSSSEQISQGASEQATGAEQINKAIQQLSQVTQQNAGASEEMASTSEELSAQSVQLKDSISFFKVDGAGQAKDRRIMTPVKMEHKAISHPKLHIAHLTAGEREHPGRQKGKKTGRVLEKKTAGAVLDSGEDEHHPLDAEFEKF